MVFTAIFLQQTVKNSDLDLQAGLLSCTKGRSFCFVLFLFVFVFVFLFFSFLFSHVKKLMVTKLPIMLFCSLLLFLQEFCRNAARKS